LKSVTDICLGTVKLGLPDYGFSSSNEKSDFNASRFLKQVEAIGITKFDTSPRYGESEKILGKHIKQSKYVPFVSSKIDGLKPNDPNSPRYMVASVKTSLEKLNKDALDICYLHQNEMDILSDSYVHEGIRYLKDLKLIEKSGASVYNHEECRYCIDSEIFDIIQIPVNVFDLSFYNQFVHNNQTSLHFVVRSLLLQGILANRSTIVARIRKSEEVLEYLSKFDNLGKNYGMSALELGLVIVFSLSRIDHFIIGTTSIENLKKDIEYLNKKPPAQVYRAVFKMASQKKSWTNPRNWK